MSSVGLLFVAVTEYKKNNLVYFGMWFSPWSLGSVTDSVGQSFTVESMWQWKYTHPMAARTKYTLQKHAPGVGGEGSVGLT